MDDNSFGELVRAEWVPFDGARDRFASQHFMLNLSRVKKATLLWERAKREREEDDLRDCELRLSTLISGDGSGFGFGSIAIKEEVILLEGRRRKILGDREELWRLKSQALCLQCGDENTKFFQACAKGRNISNTIWSLQNSLGEHVTSFDGLAVVGVQHFENLFIERPGANIAEVVQIAQFFPSFVDQADNQRLMMEVSEKELLDILHSFQKDKSPSSDGWAIEFFPGCYETLGDELRWVLNESRLSGCIHRPFNSTFLALIPKSDLPASLDEYSSISVCKCIYKIISNTIARRIKMVLSLGVLGEQFGFLEG